MKKYTDVAIYGIILILLIFSTKIGFAQYKFKNTEVFEFQKKEFNWGLHYNADTEREETRSKLWREYEELNTGAIKFQANSRFWNFLDYKQERIAFNIFNKDWICSI